MGNMTTDCAPPAPYKTLLLRVLCIHLDVHVLQCRQFQNIKETTPEKKRIPILIPGRLGGLGGLLMLK
jgi:hypothetical protein